MTDPTTDLAAQLGKRFLERRDIKSEQSDSGAYFPVRNHVSGCSRQSCSCPSIPWSMDDLRDHVTGKRTFGHYLVSQEGMSRVFVLDIDLKVKSTVVRHRPDGTVRTDEIEPRKIWAGEYTDPYWRDYLLLEMRALADGLATRAHDMLQIPVAVAYSGHKGMHVYGFYGSAPAVDVRAAAHEVLSSFDNISKSKGDNFWAAEHFPSFEIEAFPKQDTVREGDGLGNLVRLPLGVNRKSGKSGFFVDITRDINTLEADDPMKVLQLGSIR